MTEPSAPARYVQLALLIDRHFPGYVDAYYGPPELQQRATEGDPPELSALADLAESLTQSIAADPGLTEDRRAYLQSEAHAMRTTVRILAGDAPPFVEEVQLLYDVTPAWVDERRFEAAHETLADLLPGSEPLEQRARAFRERSRVPVQSAAPILRRVLDDFRERTQRLFELPAPEACTLAFVEDRPWRAYNRYLGEDQSLIEINQDFPMDIWDVPTLLAHEAYPGHHTERLIKDTGLYRASGRLEHSIAPGNSPSALISEGIAANALAAIASAAEIAEVLIECYAQAGLDQDDARRAAAFVDASRQLESVIDNQVLLLYRDGASDDEVMRYGMRFALTSEEDEARSLRFYKDPLSRSYTFNYTLGRDLVSAYLDRSADRQQAFRRLLSEPLTPSQIRGATST